MPHEAGRASKRVYTEHRRSELAGTATRSGAYLSPLPTFSLSLSLAPFHQPAARQVRRTLPSASLSRHACIHALMKRTMHTELTPLPAQLTRRITQPGGDNGEERARVPHTTTTPPHHATRPAGRISHQRSRVRPQSASVIGCRGPRELLVSSPSASTSSSPLFPRTRRTAYSSIHVVYYITYQ